METPLQLMVFSENLIIGNIKREDVIISIVSPKRLHPFPVEHREYTDRSLCVQFDDISPFGVEKSVTDKYQCMQKHHAACIVKFVREWVRNAATINDPPRRILVHCEAGVSRSPAVAIGLSIVFGLRPTPTELINTHTAYNEYVLHMILGAWRNITMHERLEAAGWTPQGEKWAL